MEYLITWKIDGWGESPEEAAKQALEIQRDPESTATVFNVVEKQSGRRFLVDLLAPSMCIEIGAGEEDLDTPR